MPTVPGLNDSDSSDAAVTGAGAPGLDRSGSVVPRVPGLNDSDSGNDGPVGGHASERRKRVRFSGVSVDAPSRRRSARLLARSGGRQVRDEDNGVTAQMSEAFGRLQDPHGCRAKVWIDKRHVAHPEWLNVLRQCGRTCVPDSEL